MENLGSVLLGTPNFNLISRFEVKEIVYFDDFWTYNELQILRHYNYTFFFYLQAAGPKA